MDIHSASTVSARLPPESSQASGDFARDRSDMRSPEAIFKLQSWRQVARFQPWQRRLIQVPVCAALGTAWLRVSVDPFTRQPTRRNIFPCQMPDINRLPIELLPIILQNLGDLRNDFASCCLVNRTFNLHATPFLYEVICHSEWGEQPTVRRIPALSLSPVVDYTA
jgi:hypothetical protein